MYLPPGGYTLNSKIRPFQYKNNENFKFAVVPENLKFMKMRAIKNL